MIKDEKRWWKRLDFTGDDTRTLQDPITAGLHMEREIKEEGFSLINLIVRG